MGFFVEYQASRNSRACLCLACPRTLVLSQSKDPLPAMDRTKVIYKILCRDCEKHYIGQTGRKLTISVHEHQLATRRHDQYSLISIHMDKENYQFDWDNTKILGQARQRKAQEFLEAWHSMKKAINKHTELDPIYTPLRRKTGSEVIQLNGPQSLKT
eukprot:g45949.t1